jgi:hypothetical protein
MERSSGIRELVAGAGVLIVLARFTDGLAAWAIAALLAGAVILGALQLFHEADAGEAMAVHPRGVPIESLVLPAILALGAVGVVHLVPIGLLEIPVVAALLWLLLRSLGLEARLARAATPPSAADRTAVLALTMLAGLAAFSGIGALVPGALPDPSSIVSGASEPGPTPSLILGLAAVDGLIAFALAYRVAALRSTSVRDVGWAASTGAAIVAIAGAALRILDIPGLLGPALLVLVFFLWEAIHSGVPARRRDPRRLWESALLLALGLVVVAWSVGLRG